MRATRPMFFDRAKEALDDVNLRIKARLMALDEEDAAEMVELLVEVEDEPEEDDDGRPIQAT